MKTARFLCLLVAGCSFGRPGKEQLGDDAWHDARWVDAMADYRAAGDSPRITAKLADAALEGGLLTESAQAWTKFGADAPDRVGEAAAGLARVADAAEENDQQAALAQAILGLRRIAPEWPLGRIAARFGHVDALQPAEAAIVIPALLSATPGRAAAEPMLLALGRADRVRGACDEAVPILEGVLRTTTSAGVRDTATTTLASCELGLGWSALRAAHPGLAERWFDRAVAQDPNSPVGRQALVGFGDARASMGDSVTARATWQSVVSAPVPPDSVTQAALLRLQQLTPTVIGDSDKVRPELL